MICFGPRSGSTLLCGLLAATGVAGRPGSHFHGASLDRWRAAHGLSGRSFTCRRDALRAVFDAARAAGTGNAGLFGLRMQGEGFGFFRSQLAILHPGKLSDAARIEAEFGRTLFIHLVRPDKLDQAISYVRADQTGLWHRNADGTELERLAPPAEPHFDPDAIARRVIDLSARDAAWAEWFAAEGVEPLRVGYEDLSADPRGTLERVLAALGLDPAAARAVEPPTAKLADAMSKDWRRRFEADTGHER